MKVVMAAEPRVYREAIGETIKSLKPHIEVAIVAPEDLKRAVSNLDPELVICSQPDTFTPESRPAWIEFRPYDEPAAKVCLGGRYSELEEVRLEDLLRVIEETEKLSQTTRLLGNCRPSS